jgi:hypothetical protein
MDRLIDDWIKERIDGTDPESMIYVAAERDPFEQYDIAMKWATFCEDEGRIDDKELGVLWMAADALKDLPTLLNESAQLSAYHSTGLTPEQVMEMKRGQEQMDLIGATPGRYEDLQRECDRLQADRDAWKRRAEAAEKVCSAAHMYVKHINSPLCVGWDMLLDALRKWTEERRGPHDEGKEVSQ